MLKGDPKKIQCPSCGCFQLIDTYLSGNDFGASFFSDGGCVAPMLPQEIAYTKCPECEAIYLTDNADTFEINPDEEIEKYTFIKPLTLSDFELAIQNGVVKKHKIIEEPSNLSEWLTTISPPNPEQERRNDLLDLRIAYWRTYNKRYSYDKTRNEPEDATERQLYENNCKEIIKELAGRLPDYDYRLILAEAYRNIGEFEKCKSTLNEFSFSDEYMEYVKAISNACDEKITHTVKVVKSC